MNNLSENLKRIRKEHNLSQEALAEQLGVSRQSVSKWESSQAYPEMEKIVLICKLYNVGVDDLLNGNIKKIEKEQKTKINVSKYINDFLNYMSKVFDVFSSMKFKDKVKCLFEQIIIIGVLVLIFSLIYSLFSDVIYSIIENFNLNSKIFYGFIYLLSDIYNIFAVIFGAVIVFQLFKIRYLDYYVIANSEENTTSDINEEEITENKKVTLNKQEKIIIRDPKHSSYRFINGLFKIVTFFVKMFLIFIAIFIAFGVMCSAIAFVLSFSIIKTGLLFVGLLILCISCIAFLVNFLVMILNFIFNRRTNILLFIVCLVISLVLFGSSFGLVAYGMTKFDIVTIDEIEEPKEKIINMSDDLYFDYYNVEYIPEDRNNIRIVYYDTDYCKLNIDDEEDRVIIYSESNHNTFKIVRYTIDNLNKYKILDYNIPIKVYASKDNIKKLRDNLDHWFE